MIVSYENKLKQSSWEEINGSGVEWDLHAASEQI